MIRAFLAPALALLGSAAAALQPVPPVPVPGAAVPAAAVPVVPVSGARPALWKVADADTTIWLFGTIHALPEGYAWRNPALEAAIADSNALVVETVLDSAPDKAAALLYSLALKPGLPPLTERVRPADRAKLAALVSRTKMPPAVLDGMETWADAIILTGVTLVDLGASAAAGVEGSIEASFSDAHKPVSGLETPAQQLGFLDALPEDEQRRLLTTMLDSPEEARAEYAAMLAAWSRGDEAAIARTFDEEAKVSPVLKDALLTRRNAAWAETIAARMAQPGHLMIAVGAGHLAGAGSVQALLAAKGLTVTRVQ